MNDVDREQWINNYEPLYNDQRRSRLSMRNFIRENRAMITAVINRELNKKPAEPSYASGSHYFR
jgi:hypothetical protein